MYLNTATTLRMRILLKLSVFVPLLAVPLVLLCWIQRQFLPYHHEGITWLHRAYVLFDLWFIWFYWPRKGNADTEDDGESEREEQEASPIVESNAGISSRLRPVVLRVKRALRSVWLALRRIGWQVARIVATMSILAFTFVIATVPREDKKPFWSAMDIFWPYKDACKRFIPLEWPRADAFLNWVEVSLHRNLVLREMTLVKEKPPPELLAAYKMKGLDLEQAWIEHAEFLNLSQRDLRYADFSYSKLYGVDFRGANLSFATLLWATLPKANFEPFVGNNEKKIITQLNETNLVDANLREANLSRAELRGAMLIGAKLHAADLSLAKLHDAHLFFAKLHGADLREAQLHGADLFQAELHGVDLRLAELHDAKLVDAKLHAANLTLANLRNSDLTGADFLMCQMDTATLDGADFTRTTIIGCDLQRIAACRETKIPSVLGYISDCLFSDGSQWATRERRAKDPESFAQTLIKYWVNQACKNSWVAKGMARRTHHTIIFDSNGRLAKGLVDAYDQAKAGQETCDGVKQLDEETIKRLRLLAEEWQSSDPNKNQTAPRGG